MLYWGCEWVVDVGIGEGRNGSQGGGSGSGSARGGAASRCRLTRLRHQIICLLSTQIQAMDIMHIEERDGHTDLGGLRSHNALVLHGVCSPKTFSRRER